MKFSVVSVAALGLAASAVASPSRVVREASMVERDLAAITSVIAAVGAKTDALDAAIKAYTSGPITPVTSASQDLIDTINAGIATVKSSADLSESDALGLTGPVQDLTKKVQTAVDDLDSRQAQVEKACAVAVTQKSLKDQLAASSALSDAITSKVPQALQGIAGTLSSGITAAIQKGITNYANAKNDASCSSSSSSSSSASSGTTATTAAASSTASMSATSSMAASSTAASSSAAMSSSASGSSTATATTPAFTGAASVNKIGFSAAGAVALAAFAVAL